MTNAELRQLVTALAKRDQGFSEATIQANVRTLLLSGALALQGTDLEETEAPLEAQLGDGTRRRIDIEAGFCVIEIKKKLTASIETEALGQLAGYVTTRQAQTGARYTGMLTDGRIWKLYRLDGTALVEVRALTLSTDDPDVAGLLTWLESVFATGQNIPTTPTAVTERLGSTSPGFALDIATLNDLYETVKTDPEVALKRELWAKSLATAFGTQFTDTDELFVNHTYLVSVAELVAHAAIGFDLTTIEPNDLLTGSSFRTAGFRGVVEADFFDWVTDIENPDAAAAGARFVRELGRRVARFDWANVQHDVLKALYESVITAETRHALGEYYTPDWLAAEIVEHTVTDPLNQRVLDPSCGSGTFLFAAIRAIRKAATAAGMSPGDTLNTIVSNVHGIDLHPVAVTLARVTYMLAIGNDLYNAQPANGVLIPVFLGDSLQWEADDESQLGDEGLTVHTADGLEFFANTLNFPADTLVDVQAFDGLVAELANRAVNRTRGHTPRPLPQALLDRYNVSTESEPVIQETFRTMCSLHDHHRDHIWGYYVRNLARPLWMARIENRVDVLAGNPPWISYRYMPAKLQEAFKKRGDALKVRPKGKLATHADLAAFFVVTAADRYLKIGGSFGFVMPRGALGGPHYSEFRTAAFPKDSGRNITFTEPWDLAGVRPHLFPVPACVVFGSNTSSDPNNGIVGHVGKMPDVATAWAGKLNDITAGGGLTRIETPVLNADAGPASPYHDQATQGPTLVPRSLLFVVANETPGPFGAPTGQTAVRSRRSGDKTPWKELPDLAGRIENQFLMPTLLGSCLVHHQQRTPETAVIPWTGTELLHSSHPEIDAHPGLASWWREAETRWDQHGSGKMTLEERINYQNTLLAQFPAPSIRVAYTTSGTYLAAAVVNNSAVVIESSCYWIPVATLDEAHYLTAILNSDALLDQFSPLQPTGQFGTRHFHRYPLYPNIPLYDATNPLHIELSALGTDAAAQVAAMGLDDQAFQKARQTIRATFAATGFADTVDVAVTALTTPHA